MVYGLSCRRLRDNVVGHQSAQWKTMEYCFRDICNISAGYKRAKGYCRDDFNTPESSMILRSRPQKNQELATDVLDPTSKTTAQAIIVATLTNAKTCHPLRKTTKEAIAPKRFVAIGTTVICSPQEPSHSKHSSKLGQAMTCWLV